MTDELWMKRQEFNDLSLQIKAYEVFSEVAILPETYIVVRVDGSNFHQFTENMKYKKPFDEKFNRIMCDVAKLVMEKYGCIYAYTQSDEISFLFDENTIFFNRRAEKIDTIIASEVASRFTRIVDEPVAFDGRIVSLPNVTVLKKYFQWRMEDANRNALNQWAYWTARKTGLSPKKSQSLFDKKGVAFKNEFLFQNKINYNEVPAWMKRGVGFKWVKYQKEGFNPITKEKAIADRRKIVEMRELDIKFANSDIYYIDAICRR